jgi:hypothetical protein
MTNETLSMPLPLELAEPTETPTEESWGASTNSNSQCLSAFGSIQVDDVQIDEVDLF